MKGERFLNGGWRELRKTTVLGGGAGIRAVCDERESQTMLVFFDETGHCGLRFEVGALELFNCDNRISCSMLSLSGTIEN